MADLSLRGVAKRFGEQVAVEAIDLDVAHGELVVLLGPTGAGKTTTLRLIAGLETPDEGEIRIGGRDVTGEPPAARDRRVRVSAVLAVPAHDRVRQHGVSLARPGAARRRGGDPREGRGGSPACCTSATSSTARRPGSRAARCSVSPSGARSVRDPAAYLMDEPLSSLDAKLRSELRLELKRIQREMGATIVYVTHDQIEAMTMADRIGVLREGRLVQVGTPARDLRDAAQRLRGRPARHAGDEPASGRPAAGRGQAGRDGDGGRADRAPASCAGAGRRRGRDGAAGRAPGRSEPRSRRGG